MESEGKLEHFICDPQMTGRKRWIGIASCILVYCVWRYVACPYLQPMQKRMFVGLEGGPKLFVTHLMLYNSLWYAALSVLAIFILVKTKIFRSPSMRWNVKPAVLQGFLVGLVILGLSIGFQLLMGGRFHFNFDPWEYAGNLFSNAYEEIFYRGFIFVGLLYFFRRGWAAAVLSGFLFGLTHTQYSLGMQFGVAAVGSVFGLLYFRTGNLVAPWIAHQMVDLLGTFFVM